MPFYTNTTGVNNGKGGDAVALDTPVPAVLNVSSTGGAAANNVALAASAGDTNFCSGFEVTGGGATAASVITVTLTGTIGGTLNYNIAVPAGATAGVLPLIVSFPNPVQASAVNTAITLNVPSFGAGNTVASSCIHGFRM